MSGDHIHPEPTTFLSKHVFSFDHKVIAKQFLWFGLFWLLIGGVMAMMIRWQLANPGVPVPIIGGMLFPRTGGVIGARGHTREDLDRLRRAGLSGEGPQGDRTST